MSQDASDLIFPELPGGEPILAQLRALDARHGRNHPPFRPNRKVEAGGGNADEKRRWIDDQGNWDSAAFRGAMNDVSRDVAHALTACARQPDADSLRALYDRCARSDVPILPPQIGDSIQQDAQIDPVFVRAVGRWLMRSSVYVEPLQLGIALVGRVGDATDVPDLRLLSRCDTFGILALDSVLRLLRDPIDAVWDMARYDGHGKMTLVEKLVELLERASANRPDIREWLLRNGCSRHTVHEELAHTCAVVGHLDETLERHTLDAELLDGACTLLEGMMDAEVSRSLRGLEDYPPGVQVFRNVLRHIEQDGRSVACLHLVARLHTWLDSPLPSDLPELERWVPLEPFRAEEENDGPDDGRDPNWKESLEQHWANRWERRARLGWTLDVRCELARECQRLIALPHWTSLVRRALESEDSLVRARASMVAPAVGIDPWDALFACWVKHPRDFDDFVKVITTPNAERALRVLRVLEQQVDLRVTPAAYEARRDVAIAFGHDQFVWTAVAYMRPGVVSEKLIAMAVRCSCLRARQAAVDAIERIPGAARDPDVLAALRESVAVEPQERLRERMITILHAGEYGPIA